MKRKNGNTNSEEIGSQLFKDFLLRLDASVEEALFLSLTLSELSPSEIDASDRGDLVELQEALASLSSLLSDLVGTADNLSAPVKPYDSAMPIKYQPNAIDGKISKLQQRISRLG